MEMIHINLLPSEFRKKKGGLSIGKTGYYAIGGVVGVMLLITVITLYQVFQIRELKDKMAEAQYRTQQLKKDIAVVDALTDVKGKIMQRMSAVDRLDQHRVAWVRILEDVSRNLPEFTWLSQLQELEKAPPPETNKSGNKDTEAEETRAAVTSGPQTKPVEMEGYSFTLSAMANLMINMMRSHFFSDVEMQEIKEVEFNDQKAYNYKLTATLHYLSDEELRKVIEDNSGPDLLASF